MCSNGHQRALSAEILVQFVLQINEAAVSCTVKVDPSQHSSYSKRPNQGSFWLDGQLQGLLPCMPSELTLLLRPFVL